MSIDELKVLCDLNVNGYYESKRGDTYIQAIYQLFKGTNLNDKPFTEKEILKQPKLDSFSFTGKNDFIYCCDLEAKPMILKGTKRTNEKIIAFNFVDDKSKEIFEKSMGVAYMMTCPINGVEYIIKFGQTRTPFKKRLGSYNCGVVYNWRTASTTNIKILQSFVTTRLKYKLYIYDCHDVISYEWHGIKSVPFATPKSLAVEDIIVKEFMKQFGRKPLANVQTNATEE